MVVVAEVPVMAPRAKKERVKVKETITGSQTSTNK